VTVPPQGQTPSDESGTAGARDRNKKKEGKEGVGIQTGEKLPTNIGSIPMAGKRDERQRGKKESLTIRRKRENSKYPVNGSGSKRGKHLKKWDGSERRRFWKRRIQLVK